MGWVLARVELSTDSAGRQVLRVDDTEVVLRDTVRRVRASPFTVEEVRQHLEAVPDLDALDL